MARISPLQYRAELLLEEGTKRRSDGVTAICTALWERALALGIPRERLLYLPSGADIDLIKPLDRGKMRDRYGITRGITLVGYISANLIDADMMLEAIACVFAQRGDCRLLFLGPDRGWHRDMAIRLGIDDRIIWTGIQPYGRIAEFLACVDIMALPMRDNIANRGRWPNRIGEHMAAGRATVACAVGDMERLMTAERIGILSRPNEDDFAEKILALLEDRRGAEELGRHAREIAETKYSWSILAERFREFLGTLPETSALRA
jgi:glycosyltransferase involved in cell wall biosynthesis